MRKEETKHPADATKPRRKRTITVVSTEALLREKALQQASQYTGEVISGQWIGAQMLAGLHRKWTEARIAGKLTHVLTTGEARDTRMAKVDNVLKGKYSWESIQAGASKNHVTRSEIQADAAKKIDQVNAAREEGISFGDKILDSSSTEYEAVQEHFARDVVANLAHRIATKDSELVDQEGTIKDAALQKALQLQIHYFINGNGPGSDEVRKLFGRNASKFGVDARNFVTDGLVDFVKDVAAEALREGHEIALDAIREVTVQKMKEVELVLVDPSWSDVANPFVHKVHERAGKIAAATGGVTGAGIVANNALALGASFVTLAAVPRKAGTALANLLLPGSGFLAGTALGNIFGRKKAGETAVQSLRELQYTPRAQEEDTREARLQQLSHLQGGGDKALLRYLAKHPDGWGRGMVLDHLGVFNVSDLQQALLKLDEKTLDDSTTSVRIRASQRNTEIQAILADITSVGGDERDIYIDRAISLYVDTRARLEASRSEIATGFKRQKASINFLPNIASQQEPAVDTQAMIVKFKKDLIALGVSEDRLTDSVLSERIKARAKNLQQQAEITLKEVVVPVIREIAKRGGHVGAVVGAVIGGAYGTVAAGVEGEFIGHAVHSSAQQFGDLVTTALHNPEQFAQAEGIRAEMLLDQIPAIRPTMDTVLAQQLGYGKTVNATSPLPEYFVTNQAQTPLAPQHNGQLDVLNQQVFHPGSGHNATDYIQHNGIDGNHWHTTNMSPDLRMQDGQVVGFGLHDEWTAPTPGKQNGEYDFTIYQSKGINLDNVNTIAVHEDIIVNGKHVDKIVAIDINASAKLGNSVIINSAHGHVTSITIKFNQAGTNNAFAVYGNETANGQETTLTSQQAYNLFVDTTRVQKFGSGSSSDFSPVTEAGLRGEVQVGHLTTNINHGTTTYQFELAAQARGTGGTEYINNTVAYDSVTHGVTPSNTIPFTAANGTQEYLQLTNTSSVKPDGSGYLVTLTNGTELHVQMSGNNTFTITDVNNPQLSETLTLQNTISIPGILSGKDGSLTIPESAGSAGNVHETVPINVGNNNTFILNSQYLPSTSFTVESHNLQLPQSSGYFAIDTPDHGWEVVNNKGFVVASNVAVSGNNITYNFGNPSNLPEVQGRSFPLPQSGIIDPSEFQATVPIQHPQLGFLQRINPERIVSSFWKNKNPFSNSDAVVVEGLAIGAIGQGFGRLLERSNNRVAKVFGKVLKKGGSVAGSAALGAGIAGGVGEAVGIGLGIVNPISRVFDKDEGKRYMSWTTSGVGALTGAIGGLFIIPGGLGFIPGAIVGEVGGNKMGQLAGLFGPPESGPDDRNLVTKIAAFLNPLSGAISKNGFERSLTIGGVGGAVAGGFLSTAINGVGLAITTAIAPPLAIIPIAGILFTAPLFAEGGNVVGKGIVYAIKILSTRIHWPFGKNPQPRQSNAPRKNPFASAWNGVTGAIGTGFSNLFNRGRKRRRTSKPITQPAQPNPIPVPTASSTPSATSSVSQPYTPPVSTSAPTGPLGTPGSYPPPPGGGQPFNAAQPQYQPGGLAGAFPPYPSNPGPPTYPPPQGAVDPWAISQPGVSYPSAPFGTSTPSAGGQPNGFGFDNDWDAMFGQPVGSAYTSADDDSDRW